MLKLGGLKNCFEYDREELAELHCDFQKTSNTAINEDSCVI